MADIYHIWADHKKGVDSYDFAYKMRRFLDGLVSLKRMKSYRLTRSKLGFRSMDMPEFHIMMEFDNMQQLDDAMTSILRNEENIDESHVSFNQLVDKETIQHFLYRDFPDKLTETQPQVKIKEQVKIEISPEMEKKMKGNYTVEEIVKSMKQQYPEIWGPESWE
tara:strand:+ start:116 stop:607 length:492 start_codon:yes stop_codon:yes gene_type:complete